MPNESAATAITLDLPAKLQILETDTRTILYLRSRRHWRLTA
ncbi:hypothetical protein PSE_0078 [Pseudovibrio sp. FO-BEG1]|nr:hypothetical protein PSE_0078 [Pseudovibrio sp. FO-BEG1]